MEHGGPDLLIRLKSTMNLFLKLQSQRVRSTRRPPIVPSRRTLMACLLVEHFAPSEGKRYPRMRIFLVEGLSVP